MISIKVEIQKLVEKMTVSYLPMFGKRERYHSITYTYKLQLTSIV